MPSRSKVSLSEENIEKMEESSVQFEVLERKTLEIVREAGEKGVLQKDLWKKLGLDSRKGLKIVRKLEEQGLILREQVVLRGRKTYVIRPATPLQKETTIPDFLEEIPCFFCPNLARCASGEVDFLECPILRRWLTNG